MTHVDLVENRWSAGYQERVGRAYEERGHVEVDADDEHYRDVVLQSMPSLLDQPTDFLVELGHRFHSDYFFATELHDDHDCPFAHGNQIPLKQQQHVVHPVG